MIACNQIVDQLVKQGGRVDLPGWFYDIVLDRLEKRGFQRARSIDMPQGFEGSVYMNDQTEVHVVTSRLAGPITTIMVGSSSKEAAN